MEPANLTPSPIPPEDDADIAAFLRRSSPPLADDGFTVNVLAALPPPRPARRPIRPALAVAGAFVGALLAWRQIVAAGGEPAVAHQITSALDDLQLAAQHAVAQGDPHALSTALTLAVGVSAASLLYTFRRELPRLLPVWLRI